MDLRVKVITDAVSARISAVSGRPAHAMDEVIGAAKLAPAPVNA